MRRITTTDLTLDEQRHVRVALLYLREKFGGWTTLSKVLHFVDTTLIHVARGRRAATASLAFRMARLVNVKIDALLAGKYPKPRACPRCDQSMPKGK